MRDSRLQQILLPATVSALERVTTRFGSKEERKATCETRQMLSVNHQLFDFGKGPLVSADDAVAVQIEMYDTAVGYGWLNNSRLTLRYRPGMGDDLLNDSVLGLGGAESTFRVDVPNGEYKLRIILGDAAGPRDLMRASANGQEIGEISTTNSNLFAELTPTISVNNGAIDLAFDDLGGDLFWSLAAIELTKVEAPQPIPGNPPALLGDYNLDRKVNAGDYAIWRNTLGDRLSVTYAGADGSGNGIIDQADYDIWRARFGNSLPVVPPPDPPVDPGQHDEPIPNFATSPSIVAVAVGDWSNPATWDAGQVPSVTDVVVIPEDVDVTISDVHAIADRIVIHGTLRFAADVDTRLRVSTLHVHERGALIVGTQLAPITAEAEIIIRDTPIDFDLDPRQYGTGLLVQGTIRMHGMEKTTFERLAAEPLAGDIQLRFAAPVHGWRAGDRLFLPDTRQTITDGPNRTNDVQSEFAEIVDVSSDGLTVTLAQPLEFNHLGARDGQGVLTILPHAANLSRNVSIESENPHGTRGHTLYTGRADVDIRYAAFEDLGRTTADSIDNTTLDAQGNAVHIGTNQIGRYSIHIHHLNGPEANPTNGHQFTVVGSASNGGEDRELHKFKWGLAIHASHYGLIADNVVQGWAGTGLLTEDGTESYNVIDHNFVGRIWGTEYIREDVDNEMVMGAGIWIRSVSNYVRNNVVANVFNSGRSAGFVLTNFVDHHGLKIPVAPGSTQRKIVDGYALPILQFDGNETYGTAMHGLSVWHVGCWGTYFMNDGSPESWIRGFTAWHYSRIGVYNYPNEGLNFDGLTLFGDFEQLRRGMNGHQYGYAAGDYAAAGTEIANANIQNNWVGISNSTKSFGQPQSVRDSYLRNQINVYVESMYHNGSPESIQPRVIYLGNILFATPSIDFGNRRPVANIIMGYQTSKNVNVVQTDEVFVTSYNRVAGDDFRVYYHQQLADFVVPKSEPDRLVGSPVAGLTNQQNWDLYGIAIAGSIAPANASERNGIYGLVSVTP
jgi:G8 domain